MQEDSTDEKEMFGRKKKHSKAEHFGDASVNNVSHSATKHFPFAKQPSQTLLDSDDDNPNRPLTPVNLKSGQENDAGPSNREKSRTRHSPILEKEKRDASPSESDESDELGNITKKNNVSPDEYDYKAYDNLNVSADVKELFQYIVKYVPQKLNLDYKFKPFVPDFIPAVGDIDAFLKIIPPQTTLSGEDFKNSDQELGLIVLDEPVANQSDPALLHLQLRAASVTINHNNKSMVVKKIDDVEKNSKTIDKWIKDVSELRRSKLGTTVKYSEPMPDIDQLLEEWPEDFENVIRVDNIPKPTFCGSLAQYVDIMCALFDIPSYKNRIESLHLLFSLYSNINSAQMYHANSEINNQSKGMKNEPDHLVLD
ncbi:hypothetical protein FQA39_LY07417 [Lamprigera yunnana]|nr:hypothetical protein FQA39_LY07417 [Lamprigera yunnana]